MYRDQGLISIEGHSIVVLDLDGLKRKVTSRIASCTSVPFSKILNRPNTSEQSKFSQSVKQFIADGIDLRDHSTDFGIFGERRLVTMSRRALEAVIGRAILDEEFRLALFADPEAALVDYELTEDELRRSSRWMLRVWMPALIS